jgi:NAD(P)-dependent dehydrogenase (short-subunit alcohol dehydrogenase family)
VNVLSPGQVDTPDSQRLDKETRQMFESLIPRGKMGRPEEIATAALFRASDDSSYVNGAELSVGECLGDHALTEIRQVTASGKFWLADSRSSRHG